MNLESIGLALSVLSGVAWTITYICIIYVGFKDKTYGMPFIAFALNIAWEALYSYYGLKYDPSNIQTTVNIVWVALDLIILYTYFKYGLEDFKKFAKPVYFVPWSILILIMSIIIQYYFSIEFGNSTSPNLQYVGKYIEPNMGAWYSAFIQNLIMSVMFIYMFLIRKNAKGQNLTIAIAKFIGTLAPTLLFGLILENKLVLVLGIFIALFDLIYIAILLSYISPQNAEQKKNIIINE